MIKKFLKKRLEANKQDLLFEYKHKKYFGPLYVRVLILCFLVAVAVYYKTSVSICHEMGGFINKTDNMIDGAYKIKCTPLPDWAKVTILDYPNGTINIPYTTEHNNT